MSTNSPAYQRAYEATYYDNTSCPPAFASTGGQFDISAFDPVEDITYGGQHMRLRHLLGSPTHWLCRCGERAQEWALKTTTGPNIRHEYYTRPSGFVSHRVWSVDPLDYAPMCRHCHRQHDEIPAKVSAIRKLRAKRGG